MTQEQERGATPGPWTATGAMVVRNNPQTITVGHMTLPKDSKRICLTDNECYTSQAEAEANARLIAACPTMYDYIAARAQKGDEDAAKIIASIKQ